MDEAEAAKASPDAAAESGGGAKPSGQAGTGGKAPSPRAPESFPGKVLSWLLVRPRIAEARRAAQRTPREEALMERAGSAFAVANMLLEMPKTPGQATARHAAVASLEALYWALLASRPDLEAPDMEALWGEAQGVVRELGLTPEQAAEMKRAVAMQRPAIALAELPEAEQAALSVTLHRAAEKAIEVLERPRRAVQVLSLKSMLRFALVLGVLAAVVVGVLSVLPKRSAHGGVDLAAGKKWTVSSKLFDCNPTAGECGGAQTKILFHTNEEDNPWFEYDLGSPQTFRSLLVVNRQDGSQERATPLVAEVSDDRKTYREVARQEAPFSVWEPKFAPQKARYVRLRAAKRTYLHLEAVEIHP